MGSKISFSFLVSLLMVSLLTLAGLVYAQEPAPAPTTPPADTMQFDDFGNSFALLIDGASFLGVYAEDINREKMARYGLREPRGVGITNVVSGSPAEKAGLRKDDVILRFGNDEVTSVRKLNRLVSEVAPDQTVRIAISRGGAEQEVAVTIGNRKFSSEAHDLMKGPKFKVWSNDGDKFVWGFGNNRRIGVSTTTLTKQLADYFGVPGGVLVTSVTADSPAAKAGIVAGDVITAADGEKIDGAGDLSRAINKNKDGSVTLTVVHNKSQRTVTVTPTEGGQFGPRTRVIVPQIDIPDIPEVNVRMPRIVVPAIPEITIDVPTRIRRVSSQRPI